jgi:hypothetical protein
MSATPAVGQLGAGWADAGFPRLGGVAGVDFTSLTGTLATGFTFGGAGGFGVAAAAGCWDRDKTSAVARTAATAARNRRVRRLWCKCSMTSWSFTGIYLSFQIRRSGR